MLNRDERNAVREALDLAVTHFLNEDPYYYVAPFLSEKEITKNCPFFENNGISLPPKVLTSEDLKTISYLAPFYRNRLAYDPKNIDRYLWATGHLDYSVSSFDLLCFEADPTWILTPNVTLGINVPNNIYITNGDS